MKRASLAALVLLGLLLLAGCGKGSSSSTTTTTTRTTGGSSSTTVTSLLATTSTTAPAGAGKKTTTTVSGTYTASLSGGDVVPPVSTTATGTATFTLASNGTALAYVLKVHGISNATVARLHDGGTGVNGPTIATLFPGPLKKGIFTGTLASGTLRVKSLGGPLVGKKLTDLLSLMKAGKTYVLLGTTKYPTGEIRGQIK
jgi:CHRD domain